MTRRILMWSGPRNVSTALMRAFEARGDCAVVDEPLYAAYLHATGVTHPGRDAILASQPTDPQEALQRLTSLDHGKPLQFEKHMAQHWDPAWSFDTLTEAHHAFLIRDPGRVVASYAKVRERPRAEDLGTIQQGWLLDHVGTLNHRPIVVDGDELRQAPQEMLEKLCAALEIPFTEAMLSWPAGPRDSDGVWAPYWYSRVNQSTGFDPVQAPGSGDGCPPELSHVAAELRPHYNRLSGLRLRRSMDMGG